MDYSVWVSWLRKEQSKIRIFIHKKCNEKALSDMFFGMTMQKDDIYDDDLAHIIATGENVVAYRIRNDIFIIPAIIKAIVNNNDGQLSCYFEYPCEMKWEDLMQY